MRGVRFRATRRIRRSAHFRSGSLPPTAYCATAIRLSNSSATRFWACMVPAPSVRVRYFLHSILWQNRKRIPRRKDGKMQKQDNFVLFFCSIQHSVSCFRRPAGDNCCTARPEEHAKKIPGDRTPGMKSLPFRTATRPCPRGRHCRRRCRWPGSPSRRHDRPQRRSWLRRCSDAARWRRPPSSCRPGPRRPCPANCRS